MVSFVSILLITLIAIRPVTQILHRVSIMRKKEQGSRALKISVKCCTCGMEKKRGQEYTGP